MMTCQTSSSVIYHRRQPNTSGTSSMLSCEDGDFLVNGDMLSTSPSRSQERTEQLLASLPAADALESFKKLVMARLKVHLNDSKLIPSFHFGFRKQLPMMQQIIKIVGTESLATIRQHWGVVLLDVQKAFDSVWQLGHDQIGALRRSKMCVHHRALPSQ